MNNRSLVRTLVIAALAVAGAAAVGFAAYNAGVAHGIAAGGQALAAPPAGTPTVYYAWRPWGFGFFPFFPIVGLLLFFFVIRGLLWRGPWRGGWAYPHDGVPPAFDEWHRRAHARTPPSEPPAGSTA